MDSRDKILKAAYELFGKRGYEAANTREIAEAAGINKATLYYHFPGKDVLFNCLLDRYYQDLNTRLQKAIGEESNWREKIRLMIDTYFDFLIQNREFSLLVQRESTAGNFNDRIADHLLPMFSTGTKLFTERFPVAASGDLAAAQLLISFYGIVVAYVNHARLLEKLLGADPLDAGHLEERKKHLYRITEIFETILSEQEKEKGDSK